MDCCCCVCPPFFLAFPKSPKTPSLYSPYQLPCFQASSFHFKTNQLATLALVSHSVIVTISRIQPKPINPSRRSIRHLPRRASPTSGFHRTYHPPSNYGPEKRAMMIPNIPDWRPAPTVFSAGRRRVIPRPAKPTLPPLSVPLPNLDPHKPPASQDCPNLKQIRFTNAVNFV